MTQANYPPQHVAIILDGNGRWAKKRGLPRLMGHRAGGNNILPVAKIFANYGVKYLTLYVFSTENWNRPRTEVRGLLRLLAQRIDAETRAFHQENIRMLHIGKLDRLAPQLRKKVQQAVELTRSNTGLTLCLAFDYGSRDEIVRAARDSASGNADLGHIDEKQFAQHLDTHDIPDPDLIIRTGGEIRLSNFLLWQAAYAELYFTPVLWPDFDEKEIEKALSEYRQRQRRFGRL
jgi:undecaprenyl diphosphate synthase